MEETEPDTSIIFPEENCGFSIFPQFALDQEVSSKALSPDT